MDNDDFSDLSSKTPRVGQSGILPSAIKNRALGSIISKSTVAAVTGSLIWYDFPLLKDNSGYNNSDVFESIVSLTPAAYGTTGNLILSSLVLTVVPGTIIHEGKINGTSRDGTENITASTFDNTVVQWGKNATPQTLQTGLNFTCMHIPKAATITSAYLFMTAKNTKSYTVVSKIYGEKVGYPLALASSHLPSSWTLTTANVDWTLTSQTAGSVVQSPDISSIIREIIALNSWSPGNFLNIVIKDNGSATNNFAEMNDYNDDTLYAQDTYLQVNYTIALPDGDAPIFIEQYQDYAGSSDTTGVREWFVTVRNSCRYLYWDFGSVRRSVIPYTVYFKAYTTDSGAR